MFKLCRIHCSDRTLGENLTRVIISIILHWDLTAGRYIATCICAVDCAICAKCASKIAECVDNNKLS